MLVLIFFRPNLQFSHLNHIIKELNIENSPVSSHHIYAEGMFFSLGKDSFPISEYQP